MDKKEGYGRFTYAQHAIFEVMLHLATACYCNQSVLDVLYFLSFCKSVTLFVCVYRNFKRIFMKFRKGGSVAWYIEQLINCWCHRTHLHGSAP